MSGAGLSVFVLAKNAEKNLAECLAGAKPLADEIVVVVDDASRDATPDVARSYTSKVFVRPFDGFSAMKGFAMAKCTKEWALNLDTDERLTPELVRDIDGVKRSAVHAVNGYAVNRLPFFLGRPIRHGGWYPDWVIRLVRRERAAYPPRPVHERLEVSGPTARLSGLLLHYTVTGWADFLEKQRRFAELSPDAPSAWARWTHPPATFLKSAVLKLGVLDGWRGLAVAYAQAYYTFYKYRNRNRI